MSEKLFVSLVGEQTIPNILGILHFKPDYLLFITTWEMKNKVRYILDTLSERGLDWIDYAVLIVKQDSIEDCMEKIQQWIEKIEVERYDIIVNITGGTKIMSIATYEVFKKYDSKIIYIPFPRNEFIILHPTIDGISYRKLSVRLKVIEYLIAHGIYVSKETWKLSEEHGKKAIERFEKTDFIYTYYPNLKVFLKYISRELRALKWDTIRKMRDGDEIPFIFYLQSPLNISLEKLLLEWGFEYSFENGFIKISRDMNYDLYHYFIGGWLEEYIYNILYDIDGITDIKLNIQLSSKGSWNEFDIMFTYENILYFVECKSLDQEHDKKQDILYKIGALQTDFGLNVKAFLATQTENIFNQNGDIKKHLLKRAKQMHTIILPLSKIKNLKGRFIQELNINSDR